MPEGPEVRVVADSLLSAVGKTFTHLNFWAPSKFQKDPEFSKLKTPFTITDIQTKGKKILIKITSHTPAPTYYGLISSLGMTGSWGWNIQDKQHTMFSFHNEETALFYFDIRRFGRFDILPLGLAQIKLREIGWDLLKSPMPENKWKELQKTLCKKKIGPELLNQSYFSSIGNIYKAEILYKLKIHPETLIGNLSQKEWGAVNTTANHILELAYSLKGSSVKDFSYDEKEGKMQFHLKIYSRTRCPEGHLVKKLTQNQRTTWYCDKCQLKKNNI